jgi:hypothetical protein
VVTTFAHPALDELFPVNGCRIELEALSGRYRIFRWRPHWRRLRPGIACLTQIMAHIAGELDIADAESVAMLGMDGGQRAPGVELGLNGLAPGEKSHAPGAPFPFLPHRSRRQYLQMWASASQTLNRSAMFIWSVDR